MQSKGNAISDRKLNDFYHKVDEVRIIMKNRGLHYRLRDLCKITSQMPAPCFYVSASKALKVYSLYKQGKSKIHSASSRRMYADIFARFEILYNAYISSGQYVTKSFVMEKVLSQEAPSFYYEGDSAYMAYYKAADRKRRHLL